MKNTAMSHKDKKNPKKQESQHLKKSKKKQAIAHF